MSGPDESRSGDTGDGLAGIERVLGAIELTPGVGPIIRYLVEWFPAVQRRQAHDLLSQLLDLVGRDSAGLVDRLRTDERLMRLVCDATRAAASADSAAKIRALARTAANGAADNAKIDEADYLIGVLEQLRAIHVRALAVLEDLHSEDYENGVDIALALDVSVPVAESLASHLVRLAVAETPGTTRRGIGRHLKIAPLGSRLLRDLRSDAIPATEPAAAAATPPPHWRAIEADQIDIVVRVETNDEAAARDALSVAGFELRHSLRDDDGTPLIEMHVLAPAEDQTALDFANEVLRAAGIESQLVMHSVRKPRPGFAYHRWRRLLAGPDLPAVNREGRPIYVLDGPDVDVSTTVARIAAMWEAERMRLE